MPPKLKLQKLGPKAHTSSQISTDSNTSGTLDLRQFEVELCWCIQQLQIALKSGKLNNKQVQDCTKSLNTLMSNNAPLIKKRQIMRLSFGDYRAKMAAEDKKKSRNVLNMKVKPTTPSKKSVFIKKSVFSHSSGNTFRFDFKNTDDHDLSEVISSVNIKCDDDNNKCIKKSYNFVPSDNSFKFDFNVNE